MKALNIIVLLLLPLSVSAAQAYKIVRPDGTVEFTDQPVKNSEEINLPNAQGYQSSNGKPQEQSPTTTTKKQNESGEYLQFAIASPAAEETIPNSGGVVSVSVNVAPALQKGHQVVITLDGSEKARGESTSFTLTDVERGAHLLGASILDASGAVLRQANPVTFYVFQQSILNPNNPINRNRR